MSSRTVYECDRCKREIGLTRYRLVLSRHETPDLAAHVTGLDLCGFCAGVVREVATTANSVVFGEAITFGEPAGE